MKKIIRDFLEKENVTFDEYLDTKKDDITKCQGLFRKDKKLLYPTDGARPKDLLGNVDLTLLAVIVKAFSVFKPSTRKGWDNAPETDDKDPVSDIVRLRIMRNDLYHSPLWAITNEKFEKKWTTLTDALIRLGAVGDSIHEVRTYRFTQPREQHKAYTKMITEQFSRDKDSVRKFIENNHENLQKGKNTRGQTDTATGAQGHSFWHAIWLQLGNTMFYMQQTTKYNMQSLQ